MPAARRPARFAVALAAVFGLVLAIGVSAAGPAGASATGPEVIAALSSPEVALGAALSVSGQALEGGAPLANAPLALEAAPYPYRAFTTIARTVSGSGGSFSFDALALSLNTRLRVQLEGAAPPATSTVLQATVDPSVALAASQLGPGRTRLSVRLDHAPQLSSRSVQASWFVAARGSDSFHLIDTTSTRELSPGVTYASATIDPPATRFVYRVCMNTTWERAMGAASTHGSCPARDFTAPRAQSAASLSQQGEASGTPLAAYPSAAAISAAVGFLDGRAGRTSLAVLDSSGQIGGTRLDERFQSASVVKVMFLTAFLQRLAADDRKLSASDESLLYPMIHESNNEAASAVLARVGDAAVARVAREVGMRDYAPGVGWWAYTQTSAADQVRLFAALERLIPPQFYGYALGLLSGIEAEQSWGIPPVARPTWKVFFKTGALPSEGLFNEAARLERPGVTFTVAVFTTGDPSMAYGEATIAGVAERLLAGGPPGA
ncbi:MAG TPA: serine hydrolase [Solirubrobacteraceae bacterium]|nr:serine hydrolase [Solirubrobacteraceae bacterium]